MKQNEYLITGSSPYDDDIMDMMTLFRLRPSADQLGVQPTSEQLAVDVREIQDSPYLRIVVAFRDDQDILAEKEGTVKKNIATGETRRAVRLAMWQLLKEITGYDPGPWGILRGVRPIKIAHQLLDHGVVPADIPAEMMRRYGVSAEKGSLSAAIAQKQRPLLPEQGANERSVSLYISIPYCPTRCVYCSFPGAPLPREPLVLAQFLEALTADVEDVRQTIRRHNLKVNTVYVGGGTPTSLCEKDFAALMAEIISLVSDETTEFTIEAGRPDSLTPAKIAAIAASGATRVSVNPQSMQQATLDRIGRHHSIQDVIHAVHRFRRYPAISVNMDVIAGLPGETEQDMINTMEKVASLVPDSLTVHTLALKKGSPLITNPDRYDLPADGAVRNMLAAADAHAAAMGMEPYYLYRQKYMTGNMENVGYARPGHECLYNILIMEERQTIIGIGPAAVTKAVDSRTFRLRSCYKAKDIKTYVSRLSQYTQQRNSLLDGLYATT